MDFRLFIREVCKFPNSHYQAIEEGLDCNAFESAGRWGSIMDRIKDIPLGNEAALYASLIDLYYSISTQIGPLFDLQSKTNLAFRDTSQKYLLDSPAFRKPDITGVSGTMPNGTPSWKDVLVCWEVKHSNKRGAQDQLGEPPRKRSKPSQSTSPSRQSNSEVAGSTPGRDSDDPLEQLPLALESTRWEMPGCWIKFDMMNKRVYKNYVDLTNIVVRVSDGTPEGKRNAVLVNSHLDSTLPSPGAADDAISVRVMLECIRVLTEPPSWQPVHSIIFLFNAEESLQDGSHLYATQHFTAHTVRAIINLEAAGSTGPELLFQATSEEMIEAYSHVLRPFGTVLANDVFSSGLSCPRAGIAVEWVWGDAKVPVASYVLGSFGPLVLGTKVATSLTDIFVPLTGRMGSLPPVNNIIALLTTVAAFYAFPLVLPLSHRMNAPEAVFWYITSGEYTLQLGSADAAPGFEALVNELAAEFGAPGAKPTLNVMDDWNLDWDVLYPFLQFVTSYKDTQTDTENLAPVSHLDSDCVRRVGSELVPRFSTTVWGSSTPHQRGIVLWDERMVDQVGDQGSRAGRRPIYTRTVKINFVGIEEKAMWPGKKNDQAGPAMEVFERMDQWFEEKREEDVLGDEPSEQDWESEGFKSEEDMGPVQYDY
ncbi:Peptidase family M28 protein [Rhizoctonia solani]|uniref:Peptide hydrolase n=1 Tax=Rhizoctonia solani TaxID=456999 RepID=A0A8H8T4X5_9AGAM|nr:Peptidase family M28 protein [Rhizoctonia solani]QRW27808.1 Peptidase family M28 protein [Rhizoctonia solani]